MTYVHILLWRRDVQGLYLISFDLHNDLEKCRDQRLRELRLGAAVTPLEFLKNDHLQEPGHVGVKDNKFSDLCVSVYA